MVDWVNERARMCVCVFVCLCVYFMRAVWVECVSNLFFSISKHNNISQLSAELLLSHTEHRSRNISRKLNCRICFDYVFISSSINESPVYVLLLFAN